MAGPVIDTHAHLQEPDFRDDAAQAIDRARAAGVAAVIVPGVDLETSRAAAALADRHPAIYFAAGLHPHEASHLTSADIAGLRALMRHPKAVAVGEIGLDYYRMHSPRETQLEAFRAMLDLAREFRLPVIVHCREAAAAVKELLAVWSEQVRPSYEDRPLGVMHYFSGSLLEAQHYVDLCFLISAHTSVTHPKAEQLREVVAGIPLESLVIETDSPYGAPQQHRRKRNEPSFVVEAAVKIAEMRRLAVEEVARVTSGNALRLFGLPRTLADAAVGASS